MVTVKNERRGVGRILEAESVRFAADLEEGREEMERTKGIA